MNYAEFIEAKTHTANEYGFNPEFLPDMLFDFQKSLVEWSCRKGRSAIFADCGLGKTFVQLAWSENVARNTGGRVLILTPLSVSPQTVAEGEKLGVKVTHRREGIEYGDRIVVTNYERLHYFMPSDFAGVVCDESSILKNFEGEIKSQVTAFLRRIPYRLLCTATAAPNDYIELGTSSEAIGELGFKDMLSMFFKKVDKTMSRKDEHRFGVYRFRGHAETSFWRWVCSWARAMRKPSDFGFSDDGFILPPLEIREHMVISRTPSPEMLFSLAATDLREQREELRRTVNERCEMVEELVNAHQGSTVSWCHLNQEAKTLKHLIKGSVEISGGDTDERKESVFMDFAKGNIKSLITKPKIAGFGMNWQHCNHHTYFPSHSYEQYYQCIRRSWRYGQEKRVRVDLIFTEGQELVLKNLKRKSDSASKMFDFIVSLMRNELNIEKANDYTKKEEVPSWL